MKVIFKPQRVETYEAILVRKNMIGKVLTDTETLKQEIVEIDGKMALKAHEIDNTEQYESVQDINIFINDGDYLIKTPNGYMKPVNQVFKVDRKLNEAIGVINNV